MRHGVVTTPEKGAAMPADDRPYQCRICRRSFGSYGGLKRHMDEHRPPRQCRQCGKMLREGEYHRC